MNLRMVGCTHRATNLDLRQQLAFGSEQSADALARWRKRFPMAELALLSTCNRVELYAAGDAPESTPESDELLDALFGYQDRRPGGGAGAPRGGGPPVPRRGEPR
jgi:glutamyl-tRNA reductase